MNDKDSEENKVNILTEAYKIYLKRGESGVFDYARDLNIRCYEYCKPCDTETPIIDETCLVCGSEVKRGVA